MTPPRIKAIPRIFRAVKASLKIMKEAKNIKIYTSAVDTGII